MEAPPNYGDPYTWLNLDPVNQTRDGVGAGWDSVAYFWGTVAQQAASDLDAIAGSGGVLA